MRAQRGVKMFGGGKETIESTAAAAPMTTIEAAMSLYSSISPFN
jgi:hypothetical protein